MDGADLSRLPLTSLAGVGPARAERLARLGIVSVRDLLVFLPRGILRQGATFSVAAAGESVGQELGVRGRVRSPRVFRRGPRRSTVSADVEDQSGKLRVLFFNQTWILKRLRELAESGEEVELYGKVVETKSGPALASPRIGTAERPLPSEGTILPIYPLTEGIGQDFLRGLASEAAGAFALSVVEPLPEHALEDERLMALPEAVRALHRPSTEDEFRRACGRLGLERLLFLQAALEKARERADGGSARAVRLDPDALARLRAALPFSPTPGQESVLRDLERDLARTRPMRRLVHGDVGSGKTLVALFAIALAARARGQSALLAPTEVLAEQHHATLQPWLEALGLRAVLVTGSRSAAERRRDADALADGSAQLAIGTHALLSGSTRFARLDLVVIDEQQRFGVDQKHSLLQKGDDVHLLMLSATPIPRTLALTLYADLDVSRIADRPSGRGAVSTRFVEPAKRQRMLRFLGERMNVGEHVFWVCPRIEDESGELAAAEERFDVLSKGPLARHGIELLHGRLPAEERSLRLERFRRGDARMIVCTSIVEVGVDVPEATVMVIEGAERFGLSQLHQLRGRIGRGPRPAWCLLFAADTARARLEILTRTNDGFRIAEQDLLQRGMGDLAGSRQAGRDPEGLIDPVADAELVEAARRLLAQRPILETYLALVERREPALV